MKKKLIIIGSLIVLLVFGFLYSQNSNLIADDKDKKDCSSKCTDKTGTSSATNKSECTQKNTSSASTMTDDKDGYAVYEFVTDKITCDGCKPGMSEKLMGVAGIKEVNYGETCQVSKMTSVKVYYSAADTTPEIIAASVKENGLSCDKSKCGDGKNSTDEVKTEKKL